MERCRRVEKSNEPVFRRTDRVNALLWQDGDHGEGRAGPDGPFGVEEGPCLWPLHG